MQRHENRWTEFESHATMDSCLPRVALQAQIQRVEHRGRMQIISTMPPQGCPTGADPEGTCNLNKGNARCGMKLYVGLWKLRLREKWNSRPVDAGVCQIINKNQIQDGYHSSHVGWAVALVIERNLPPVTSMSPQKIRPVDPGVGEKINGNQIQDGGCSGQLGWVAELIIERNLPLVSPSEPQKNRMNRNRRLSSNRQKPNPRWRP
jgi:hypothetical protein